MQLNKRAFLMFSFSLTRMIAVLFALFSAIELGVIDSSYGVMPDEILTDQTLEARARKLASSLRCLICQTESIDESSTLLARDIRLLIREKLNKGNSDDEIINFITARYGDSILMHPPFNRKTAALWLAPPIILILILLTFLLRRYRRG